MLTTTETTILIIYTLLSILIGYIKGMSTTYKLTYKQSEDCYNREIAQIKGLGQVHTVIYTVAWPLILLITILNLPFEIAVKLKIKNNPI